MEKPRITIEKVTDRSERANWHANYKVVEHSPTGGRFTQYCSTLKSAYEHYLKDFAPKPEKIYREGNKLIAVYDLGEGELE